MTNVGISLSIVPGGVRVVERIGAMMVLAGFLATAAAFYHHAYRFLTGLQQIGPDELIRAFTGF